MDRRKFVLGASALGLGGLLAAPTLGRGASSRDGPLDAVIVGGGASGLAAAWLLKDYRIQVLEAEAAPGGRTLSGQWNGFHYTKGTEYIGEPEGSLADWIADLDLDAIAIPPPTGGVAHKGQIWTGRNILGFLGGGKALKDYERLAERLEALNGSGIGDAVAHGARAMGRFRALDHITVANWLARENIHPRVRELVDVENRGLFGAANADLSLAWNVPEMTWNLHDPDEADAGGVYSFPRGMAEIIGAATRGLGPGVARTGARVERVALDGTGEFPVRVTYRQGRNRRTVAARACILTPPAPIAAGIAGGAFSNPVRQALRSIPYGPYVTVNLMLKRRVLHESWSLAALGEFFVTLYDAVRTQVEPGYMGPAVLGVYIAPERASDRSLLAMPDEAIIGRVLEGLGRYVPEIRDLVLGHDIHRFRHAFPVFRPGYTEALQTLETDPSVQGPLVLAGDYMVYATFDGAVESAVRAVERLEDYF